MHTHRVDTGAATARDERRARDELATVFEAHRPYLRRLAYGTLGSFSEAEDVVQEAWLRLARTDTAAIRDVRAWLTTVVGRLALDAATSARRRRELYVGPWLPEPDVAEWQDPADRLAQDERVTTALLLVLERLSPAERTAFILQDIFGLSSEETGTVVGRTPAAVRQLVSRARRHVRAGTPRFPASREEHRRLVNTFAHAWSSGDLQALLGVLDTGVTLRADGGGKVATVGRPIHGAERVASTLLGLAAAYRRRHTGANAALTLVNGLPGLIIDEGDLLNVVSLTVDNQRIVAIDIMRNPDKLAGTTLPPNADTFEL
ncbi:MAG: RNA polymerase sigma factor SigJ [Thermomicrobiales bacterium]